MVRGPQRDEPIARHVGLLDYGPLIRCFLHVQSDIKGYY